MKKFLFLFGAVLLCSANLNAVNTSISEDIYRDCWGEAIRAQNDVLDSGGSEYAATEWGNAVYASCYCSETGGC